MRDANINIKLSDLKQIFSKLGIEGIGTQEFARACLPFNCKTRVNITTTTTKSRKIQKTRKINIENVNLFRTILMSVRTEQNHNFDYLKYVNEKSVDYTNLSQATEVALDFAHGFNMTKSDGFEEYIKIAIKLMRKKFSLNKFKYLAGKVFEVKRIDEIVQGEGLKKGAIVAKEYFKQLESHSKIKYTADVPNDVFVNFIYAAADIEAAKANIRDWITAQFEGLAFMDVLPEINQLHESGAKERYLKFKFGKMVKKGDKTSVKIDVGMMDEETKAYFKELI